MSLNLIMNVKPYVGVTGLTTVRETADTLKICSNLGFSMESHHIPMFGFLVSQATLRGLPTQNRRYPPVTSLPDLFAISAGQALNMIHYSSKDEESLSEQVRTLFDGIYQSELCQAIQLNILWPNVN